MTCNLARRPPEVGMMDGASFRRAMGRFATGVAVVTTEHNGVPFGMTVNSLTSVSLDPCLLLVCPKKGSATGNAIKSTGRFTVNILQESQKDLCLRFVGDNAERFEGLTLESDAWGSPLLPGSLAQISCRLDAIHPGGDHDIVVGEVMACVVREGEPLIFHDGQFCKRLG